MTDTIMIMTPLPWECHYGSGVMIMMKLLATVTVTSMIISDLNDVREP